MCITALLASTAVQGTFKSLPCVVARGAPLCWCPYAWALQKTFSPGALACKILHNCIRKRKV